MSIQVTIDPLNAAERPDIKFLGSERAITPFQESLTERFQVNMTKKPTPNTYFEQIINKFFFSVSCASLCNKMLSITLLISCI